MDRQQPLDAGHDRPCGAHVWDASHRAHPQAHLTLHGVHLTLFDTIIDTCSRTLAALAPVTGLDVRQLHAHHPHYTCGQQALHRWVVFRGSATVKNWQAAASLQGSILLGGIAVAALWLIDACCCNGRCN